MLKKNNDTSLYYKAISRLKCNEAPKAFSPCDIYPGKSEVEVAENAADYFTRIAEKFEPIGRSATHPDVSNAPALVSTEMVRKRLRECKKSSGLLLGDIWPDLLTANVDAIAPPLTVIINKALEEKIWPTTWKLETVSIIPKKSHPETLGDTRNISYTPVFSKILEFFVLQDLKKEIMPASNQFGGLPGRSTNHYLVRAWDEIWEALD